MKKTIKAVGKSIKEGAHKAKESVKKYVQEQDNRRIEKEMGKHFAHKEKLKHMSKEERQEALRKELGGSKPKMPGYLKSMAKEMASHRAEKEKISKMSKEEKGKEFDRRLRRGEFTR